MKGVQLTKMVQELELNNLTPEIDQSGIVIKTAEINRPALQLTGYLEHFANERVQIIGYVEYTYLMQLNEEERVIRIYLGAARIKEGGQNSMTLFFRLSFILLSLNIFY